MFDLIAIYVWSIVGGTLLGVSLAVVGVHMASRGRSLQVLNSAQGAELGTLSALLLGFAIGRGIESASPWLGLLGATGGALLFGFISRIASAVTTSSRSPLLLAIWVFLVASTQLAIALHPRLESHFTRMLMGDLTTLSNLEAQLICVFGCTLLLWLKVGRKGMIRRTFDSAVLRIRHLPGSALEEILILTLIALSTWAFGFLFTCGALLIPSSILSFIPQKTASKHVAGTAGIALATIPTGFILSLTGLNIPTTPSVVVSLVIGSLVALIFIDTKRRFHYR